MKRFLCIDDYTAMANMETSMGNRITALENRTAAAVTANIPKATAAIGDPSGVIVLGISVISATVGAQMKAAIQELQTGFNKQMDLNVAQKLMAA